VVLLQSRKSVVEVSAIMEPSRVYNTIQDLYSGGTIVSKKAYERGRLHSKSALVNIHGRLSA
jgi:hypothetical protein